MKIRPYSPNDYEQIASLYKQGDLYGGQFDENRDSSDRLKKRIETDPDTILVAEAAGIILGTVSLIEDGRVAWLFRFAVVQDEKQSTVAAALHQAAIQVLKDKGHKQVLVYSPAGNEHLNERYKILGFNQGSDYTCFWQDI